MKLRLLDHDPPPPLLLDHDPSPPRLLDHELSPMIFQVDVYSFGMAVWEIITGEEPYANMHCGAIIASLPCFADVRFAKGVTYTPPWGLSVLAEVCPTIAQEDTRSRSDTTNVITQPRPDKILSALGFNKARTGLFLGRPYTPKRVLPIKVWITPYKSSISPVLYRCGIRLGCYS
ncbi:hypothetical protein WN944_026451 [Citrus x changshan-huyou]|uniref:Serine-threonine/tyrosine-protein kinase catalytic domain-containing protein n=1 Tax=Citrus x changshan-huyou TaxID=2935761 RepID=A0AAP0LY29_9ROSI